MLMICPNLSHWWPRRKGQNQDKNTSALLKMTSGPMEWTLSLIRTVKSALWWWIRKTPLIDIYLSIWISDFVLSPCVGTDYCIHPHCQQLQTKIFFTIPVHPLCVTMHARLTPESLHWSPSVLSFLILSNTYRKFALWFQGKTKMDSQWYLTRDDLFKNILSSP